MLKEPPNDAIIIAENVKYFEIANSLKSYFHYILSFMISNSLF